MPDSNATIDRKSAEFRQFALRARAAFYGLILGDIAGSYFEFSARGPKQVPPLREWTGTPNVFGIPFGYTDDTILALLAMDSLIACGGRWYAESQREYALRYARGETDWSPNGHCFDIGISTRRSLEEGEWPGKRSPQSAGNGVLMKLLPYAIARCLHPEQPPADYYRAVADLTHGCDSTVETAQQMGLLLERLLQGESWHTCQQSLPQDMLNAPIDNARAYRGFCEDSWVFALQLMHLSHRGGGHWEHAIQQIMDLGGDTDTNAAIFGQLYGASSHEDMIFRYDLVRAHVHRAAEIDQRLQDLLHC